MIKTALITVSSSRGKKDDSTGKELMKRFKKEGYEITGYSIVQDDKKSIKDEIVKFSSSCAEVVFTSGGTGLGPCDVTPEATLEVSEREVPGISQLMRLEGLKKTKRAALSRGVSAVRGETLIINLPGSPAGARESLSAVTDILPHAVHIIKGGGHL